MKKYFVLLGLAIFFVICFFVYNTLSKKEKAIKLPVKNAVVETVQDPFADGSFSDEAEKVSIDELKATEQPVKDELDHAAFDIVRVEEDGLLVVAGRGVPGEKVSLMDDELELLKIDVDDAGQWASISEIRLDPGAHKLWLKNAKITSAEMAENVVVNVAEQDKDTMAVLVSSANEDVKVLQMPEETKMAESVLDVTSVNYVNQKVTIAGSVKSKGKINLYVNNNFVGKVFVDKAETWNIKTSYLMKKGLKYTIRADQADETGKIVARVEVPFEIVTGLAVNDKNQIRVVKGDCLWNIAKYAYGDGFAYMTIYQANKNKIKDPNLIYPNQVFVIPSK